jgi:hypothetical protein
LGFSACGGLGGRAATCGEAASADSLRVSFCGWELGDVTVEDEGLDEDVGDDDEVEDDAEEGSSGITIGVLSFTNPSNLDEEAIGGWV